MKNPLLNFEYGKEAKQAERATRKARVTIDGTMLPGLFQSASVTRDTVLVILGLFLEVYGLGNVLLVGRASVLTVPLAILVDLVFAYLAHAREARACELQNRRVFMDDPDKIEHITDSLKACDRWRKFWSCCIFALALAKAGSFYALNGGAMNLLTIGVFVSYAVVAAIHVTVTGYFMSYTWYWLLSRRDFRNYVKHDSFSGGLWPHKVGDFRRIEFEGPSALKPATANRHRLEILKDLGAGKVRVVLLTWGILEDSSLLELVNQQPDIEAKLALARAAVRHQVEDILPAEPVSFRPPAEEPLSQAA